MDFNLKLSKILLPDGGFDRTVKPLPTNGAKNAEILFYYLCYSEKTTDLTYEQRLELIKIAFGISSQTPPENGNKEIELLINSWVIEEGGKTETLDFYDTKEYDYTLSDRANTQKMKGSWKILNGGEVLVLTYDSVILNGGKTRTLPERKYKIKELTSNKLELRRIDDPAQNIRTWNKH